MRNEREEGAVQKRRIKAVMLITMAFTALHTVLSQDAGPILHPRTPAPATLLVVCDLTCNWKLDGEAKGSIEAAGSAKAKVQFGEHIVVAITEDGLDQAQQIIKVHEKGQTAVSIELEPVREARLKTEQEAKEKAKRAQQETERAEREKAARDQQERDRQAAERAAQEELNRLIWIDPATGLMWTKKDNGSDLNAQEALNYCRNLRLAGHSDWQLPTIDQLATISDPAVTGSGWGQHIKGNLQISGFEWGTSIKKARLVPWTFNFYDGSRLEGVLGERQDRALCVRRSGQ
jgi:hypothetical protein